jgi:DNA-binding MarR family transcriptional regulator
VQPTAPAFVEELDEVILQLGSLGAPRSGLSRTAAATLVRLQRSGPARLTELAVAEGVTQPSMSTLVARPRRPRR